MTQQNNTIVKEEWADIDMDIGPTVFQPMDCYYSSHKENQDGDRIKRQLQYHEIKREYRISIEDENAAENRELGYGIPDKTELELSSLHVECLESIWCVLLPRLQIFQCEICHTVYADKSKFQQHTCSVKSPNKCKLCDKWFEKSNLLIKHVRHRHKLHMCEVCGKTLKNRCIYLRHIKFVHFGKWENYHCVSCNKIYKGKIALRDHIRYSHSSAVYKCTECDRVFKMNVDLQRHISVEHRNERHECEYCFKVYKAQYLLKRHYKVHSGFKHECEVCKRSFTSKASLRLHFKVTHVESDLKIYKCEKCFKIFKWPNHLSAHIKNTKCLNVNMHYEEKQLAETTNGEQINSSSKRNYDNIVRIGFDMEKNKKDGRGQPKLYTCDYCKTTLGHKATLKRHIQSTHATGSHKCEQCGKTYRCKDYLSHHIAQVHISEQHECDKCCKIFKSKSLLWSHMNYKHSTKKLQCTMCPRVFRLRPSLRYHMVSAHSQERHKCNKCKRVFKVRSLLLQHFQRNHTNKTYECDNCSKVFKLRSTLRIHLLNEICLKGKKQLKNVVVVKEGPADDELEIGPVTFQHMDCNYRPYKEEPLSD